MLKRKIYKAIDNTGTSIRKYNYDINEKINFKINKNCKKKITQ